ncbi:MAG: repeat domain protein [Verrucomicrobiales bacterium]|nr:repeat domain protein [Verrucomicrobiales bacterium]
MKYPPPLFAGWLSTVLTMLLFSSPASLEAAVPAVAVGYQHSLFLNADGEVLAAGVNTFGQLGDGTWDSKSTPVTVLSGIQAIAAGMDHSLFLDTEGAVWAAGDNSEGQLGDGTKNERRTPTLLTVFQDRVRAIAAGSSHSLFLMDDGTVMSVGYNGGGQLGNNSTSSRTLPAGVRVVTEITALAAGGAHSLFLKADGTVWAAGDNSQGQLGDGTRITRLIPMQVPGLSGIVAISAGQEHSLFLREDGTVLAAGANASGQLGDGTTTSRTPPVPVLRNARAIWAGGSYTEISAGVSLFVKKDGTVMAAGSNYYGQLGDGTAVNRSVPVRVPGISGVVAAAAGGHSFFLKADGSVWGTGRNDEGQLGTGLTRARGYYPTPVAVPGLTDVRTAVATLTASLMIKNDGTVMAMGSGYAGNAVLSRSNWHIPRPVPGLTDVKSIAEYVQTALILKNDGTVMGWGRNSEGQFGNGTTASNKTPALLPDMAGVKAVSMGELFSLFLMEDGTVRAAGRNHDGQLGDGTTVNRITAIQVPDLAGVQAVSAGISGSFFLKADGSVWVAGRELRASFPTSDIKTGIARVDLGKRNVIDIEARGRGFFLDSERNIFVVDYDEFSPTVISDRLDSVQSMSASDFSSGSSHYLFLRTDGTVASYGNNNYGQLGDGTVDNKRPPPAPLPDLRDIRAVSAAGTHSLFVKTDGTVMAAGDNSQGQLGLSLGEQSSPTFVLYLAPVRLSPWQREHFGALAENPAVTDWDADPDRDGVPNLLERAFNLPPLQPGTEQLPEQGGTAGLPTILLREKAGVPMLAMRYLRLRGSAEERLVYTPQFSSAPDREDEWTLAAGGVETVEPIDAYWERVTVQDTVTPSPSARFGRVKVAPAVDGDP